MCGAVTVDAEPAEMKSGVCHCDMCRRWSGLALMAVSVHADKLQFGGKENIRTIQSSPWAERAWCDKCGSGIYYRITAEGPFSGTYMIPTGLFDEPGSFEFSSEIYIDQKPDNFEFAGQRKTMTKAEIEAAYGPDQ